MSQVNTLLWINKDATNVHRKKHVAEVNAHVQKSNSKKRPRRKSPGSKKTILPTRKKSEDVNSLPSPGTPSASSQTASDATGDDLDSVAESSSSRELLTQSRRLSHNPANAIIFSSYLEDDFSQLDRIGLDLEDHIEPDSRVAELTRRLGLSIPADLDASNPLPGFFTDLSSGDKMLIHTHLTYMPQMFYGLSNHATYCPIRTASVTNMMRAPVGILWVLISLEMYLETARRSTARRDAIIQRKSYAYQLMSRAFNDPSRQDDPALLHGPTAAAIAEMFCGDPNRAITHLKGIDAFIRARGGIEYIRNMEPTTSMPVFAVFAYRTLLQDNLTTVAAFQRARTNFVSTIRWLISWNIGLAKSSSSRSRTAQQATHQDEGFDGDFDISEGLEEFRETRARVFRHNPLLSKFITAEFMHSKPGEKVDHFVTLFNLARALADHGSNYKQAINFIYELIEDVETGGSTRGIDSSINISGVLRLITNRQTKMYPHQPSAGVVQAWDALDALEIMKLLPEAMQKLVCRTLYALILGDTTSIMDEQDILALESAVIQEWRARHPDWAK